MKFIFLWAGLHLFSSAFSQNGEELLVYSLKGNVTVLENNKESKLKIGKVLKPGATVKTQRDAQLTMVCKEGRPISVTREGSFPVEIWKDSCSTNHISVTSKYFQYIWDQLYVRSDDYKKSHPGVTETTGAPVRGNDEKEIIITESLDTMNYATGLFYLSWATSFPYSGDYVFVLTNTKTKKQVYADSNKTNMRNLNALKKYMKPGNSYSWSVSTRETGLTEGGIINCLSVKAISQHAVRLRKNISVPEEPAAQYFRTAYLLEQGHYLADAYLFYIKAAQTDRSIDLYFDVLNDFAAKFNLGIQR